VSAIAAVTATFYIPPKIAEGLASGTLERIGGVVREAGTKKVVAWLREIPGAQVIPNPFSLIILPLKPGSSTIGIANLLATMRGFRQMNLRLDQIEHLIHINTAVSALTLGTAVAGFSVINHRLNKIENRLEAMQEQLNEIGQKVDLGFYATFKAALDMAQRAFSMDDAHNRKAMALRAIQSFAESEHIYGAYLDQALKNQDRAVNEYLTILALLCLTEARCYLELGEYTTALTRLREGSARLQGLMKLYIEMLLTSNPAAYLTPFLKEEISLARLTQVYQWLEPGIEEAEVFEKLRQPLFDWHKDASMLNGFRWLQELPPAILAKAEFEKKGYFKRSEQVEQALTCLPGAMATIESTIETHNRLRSYQAEIWAMKELNLSFQEWMSLSPQEEPPENAQMMCIMAA
jgi:hypothetical protein